MDAISIEIVEISDFIWREFSENILMSFLSFSLTGIL